MKNKVLKIIAIVGLSLITLFILFGFIFMMYIDKLNPIVFIGFICGAVLCITSIEEIYGTI